MVRFTNEENADMHLIYGQANGNARLAARLYQDRFPNRHVPDHRYFANLHQRLRENGSFRGNREAAGRPRLRNNFDEQVLQQFQRILGQAHLLWHKIYAYPT